MSAPVSVLSLTMVFMGALLIGAVLVFNTLIRRRNAAENAFAAVDVYLTMRWDLIPNLVETVRGYAQHERDTLNAVVEMRARAMAADLSSNGRVELDNGIREGMGRLFALAEGYPELRASESFQQLQRALNEVEERLSAARRAFNAAVLDYNNAVDQFPTNLVAMALHFRRRAFLAAADQARAVPSAAGLAAR
ncbi:MAG TPA: LemA family protein [Xanthomonadaceae bacterium]|nr:LemA family protein [Xanthomonadaceae bacterium]